MDVHCLYRITLTGERPTVRKTSGENFGTRRFVAALVEKRRFAEYVSDEGGARHGPATTFPDDRGRRAAYDERDKNVLLFSEKESGRDTRARAFATAADRRSFVSGLHAAAAAAAHSSSGGGGEEDGNIYIYIYLYCVRARII